MDRVEEEVTNQAESPTQGVPPDPLPSGSAFNVDAQIGDQWARRAKLIQADRAKPMKLNLPSGLSVMAIRAPMRWLLRHDRVPDPLLANVEKMVELIEANDEKSIVEELEQKLSDNPEKEFMDMLKVMNGCWVACVTFPEFTLDLKFEGNSSPPYHVNDVEYFDKMYLYNWAQGVDQSVEDFFREQAEIVGTLENVGSVPLSPESNIRIDRHGRFVAGNDGGQGGVPIRDIHPEQNRRARRAASARSKKTQNRVG